MNSNKKSTSFMKNVLFLMCSEIIVKILGLVYKLIITNIEGFGDTGLGYYSSGYQIYALLLTLCSIGIPSVISKLISERLAVGNKKGAQRVFKVALCFFAGLGLLFSITLYFGAEFIASNLLNVPDVKYVLKVLAPAIVFVSTSSVLRGYFAGQQNMKPTSITQILEQFLNCVLSIVFVYALIGKDPYIMAAGGNLSSTVAIIITFIYLVTYYKKNKMEVNQDEKCPEDNKTNLDILKVIWAISIPMTIGSIISVVSSVIDTATVSNCIQQAFEGLIEGGKEALEQLAMQKAGILSKVDTLTNLPIAVNLAFSTALVPAISNSIAQKDHETASKRLSFSLFASIIIIIPCAIGFITLSKPILNLIYPNAPDGSGVLQLASISMIFVALSQTINGGLYGINKTHIPAIALAIGAAIKVILNIILISNPNINIYGAPISSIVCQIIAFTICYKALTAKIKLNLTMKRNIIKPIAAGFIMGAIVYVCHKGLNMIISPRISTIIAIGIGVIVYIVALLKLNTLTKEEIMMIPYGTKIYNILLKLKLCKE